MICLFDMIDMREIQNLYNSLIDVHYIIPLSNKLYKKGIDRTILCYEGKDITMYVYYLDGTEKKITNIRDIRTFILNLKKK